MSKSKRLPSFALVTVLMLINACDVPVQNDVVHEIMSASKGVVGKVVPVTSSKSLGSLSDAARLWQDLGWQKGDPSICKARAPSQWVDVQAFDYERAITDASETQSYNLRLCATQLNNPKAIAAFGLVVSSQKIQPFKPT